MGQSLAHLQMFDYLLKKYRDQAVFPDTQMVVEIDGKLWTGNFLQLEDCNIIEVDWDDQRYTQVEKTRQAINDEFDASIQNSNVNVSENRLDAKLAKIKNSEILYEEIKSFVSQVNNKETTLKPYLYDAYCLDTRVKLPFLDLSNKTVQVVALSN
ncbi:hypothetical protein MFLO_13003 [Listeria floridensis FSL S10-1187]|uniref:Uncharacterized protein n=1 Tax=Listeria floridensis FSL S10-1187 TaxID=1265817 RepID=A0ABP3AWL5_9LIST|nr:hypothetical protein [Listeria floridensis]EUJ27388.1 hypothetical protein MFLO_13003 [Listeria floridensis FSL S10-1187]